MAQQKLLELKQLKDAKICADGCKHVYENGSVVDMKPEHVVYCVGCGRKCHMPCHQVPEAMVNAVKPIPMNNRAKAYFGEMSYIKIVCDNCANLLISDVPNGAQPSFLTLFNTLAAKLIEKIGVNSDEKMDEGEDGEMNGVSNRNKKRKGESLDTKQDILCELVELKSLLSKCFIKINNVKHGNSIIIEEVKSNTENKSKIESVNSIGNIERSVSEIVKKLDENNQQLVSLHTKMDGSAANMDDGFQKGFNKLADLTEIMNSPSTPVNNDNWYTPNGYPKRTSMRRTAFSNQQRQNRNGTPTSSSFGGPLIPTETGAATDESLFGPAVPRKLNFIFGENQQSENVIRKEFRHEEAVYIRYVDASITAEKMLTILTRNEVIKREVDKNPEAVEITRLVKKRWSEDEIAQRRFGISYRIGCSQDLLPVISDKSMWANHWEIRQWDKYYVKNEQNGQRYGNKNFRQQQQRQIQT